MKLRKVFYLLSIFAFILWWGGFTFYAAFVVPTGMKVLGNHVLMGFITEQVTMRLNVVGIIAVLSSILYLDFYGAIPTRKVRRFMIINLSVLGILLSGLMALHSYMDSYMDFTNHKLINEPQFYILHRIYLLASTVMWVQGIVHITLITKKRIHA